jgi:cell division initiation protein
MNLSPLLIKKQEFEKSMRGYNVEEVQAFLNKISSEMEKLLNQKEQLEIEVERLTRELDEFHKTEKKLQDDILKAKESSDQALESGKKQSELIIKEAEVKASKLILNAEEKINAMQNAVMTLRGEKDLIIARLRAIVGTQSNLLEGKVKDAGEEQKKPKARDEAEKLDIDLDGIVDKLL